MSGILWEALKRKLVCRKIIAGGAVAGCAVMEGSAIHTGHTALYIHGAIKPPRAMSVLVFYFICPRT